MSEHTTPTPDPSEQQTEVTSQPGIAGAAPVVVDSAPVGEVDAVTDETVADETGTDETGTDESVTDSAPADADSVAAPDDATAPATDAASTEISEVESPEPETPAAETGSPETADLQPAEPAADAEETAQTAEPEPETAEASDTPTPASSSPAAPSPTPPTPKPHAPTPHPPTPHPPTPHPPSAGASDGTPAVPPPAAPATDSARFGRVADDGTVYVRTPEGEREVGSYPGATAEEALAYFARKFDEIDSLADLLYQRVTQTDLSAKDGADGLKKLRDAVGDLRAVGDLVALSAKVENIATALEARRVVESEQRAVARAEAVAAREQIVAEAERIAAQPETKVQWKSSSARMRTLLDEWKAAQRGGPKIDRDTEQALWHRLSSSRNSFDKMRRVHFAQLGSSQSEAKSAKQELVEEAEQLATSTDWGATAGAYKRLMDRWRQAGRASRNDDDALWKRFKAAQDAFFAAKDSVVAAENEEFHVNLVVKEELLTQAQALLPVRDLEATKAQLRALQEKWDAAGKVPRADMDRIEKAMRRVEQSVRDAEDKRWKSTNPEVAARAASLASQAEAALEKYRRDLEKAQASGDQRRITKAREALEARESWLKQARAGLAEFGG